MSGRDEAWRNRQANRESLMIILGVLAKDPSEVAEEVRRYLLARRAKERRPAYTGRLQGQVGSQHRVGGS